MKSLASKLTIIEILKSVKIGAEIGEITFSFLKPNRASSILKIKEIMADMKISALFPGY